MAQAQVPEVRWAQRSSESEHEKNLVFLTIVTPDIVKPEISIQAKKIVVKGADKHGKTYNLDLDLYAEIEPESTKQRNTDLNLFFVLQKKEDKVEFWPRLSAGKEKLHNVRTDFDKWVDEDEQEEQPEMPDMGGMGGPDMASMMGGAGGAGGAGGMGGMGGLDFSKLAGMGGAGAGGQPDFAEMMKSMGGGAGFGGGAAGGEDEDEGDSDDDMPALEEVKE